MIWCSTEQRLLIIVYNIHCFPFHVFRSMGIFEVFVEDSNPGDGFGSVRVRSAYERVYRESLYRIKRYMHFQIGLSCTNIECVSSLRCYLYSSKWDNNGSLRTLNSTQTV